MTLDTITHLQDAVQVLGLVPLDQPIVLGQRGEVSPLALGAHAGQHHWWWSVSIVFKAVSSWVTCHPPGPLEAQHVGIVEHPGNLLPPGHLVPQQPLPRPAHLRQGSTLVWVIIIIYVYVLCCPPLLHRRWWTACRACWTAIFRWMSLHLQQGHISRQPSLHSCIP